MIRESVFTIEPLLNLYPKISKIVQEGTVSFSSSDRLRSRSSQREEKLFVKIGARVLQGRKSDSQSYQK